MIINCRFSKDNSLYSASICIVSTFQRRHFFRGMCYNMRGCLWEDLLYLSFKTDIRHFIVSLREKTQML